MRNIILVVLVVLSGDANAFYQCYSEAAQRYNVPVELLLAISKVESSFNPKAINTSNRNGTSDYGLMQINSRWFPELEKKYGVTRTRIINDPCTNIMIGAWIISTNFHGQGAIWNSVGAYNAGFSAKNASIRKGYVAKVKRYYDEYRAYYARVREARKSEVSLARN